MRTSGFPSPFMTRSRLPLSTAERTAITSTANSCSWAPDAFLPPELEPAALQERLRSHGGPRASWASRHGRQRDSRTHHGFRNDRLPPFALAAQRLPRADRLA